MIDLDALESAVSPWKDADLTFPLGPKFIMELIAELRVARAVVAALTGDNYRFLSDRTKLALDAYDEATK